jgi:two-component system, sensor histidine kinase and response regulator
MLYPYSMGRVLIVDDDARNLDVLEAVLGPAGYTCVRADSGRAALAQVAERRPDCVLLDLHMPGGLDGMDVLLHLRQGALHDQVPVIVVTAHDDREHRVRALQAGADDFLEKPIDTEILLARVRTVVNLRKARDEQRRLERDQREFMQFVIHDLKNPLAILALNLGCLQTSDLADPDMRGAVDDSIAATQRLQMMVEDLLTIARLEEVTAVPLEREPVEVSELVSAVVRSYSRLANAKSVDLVSHADARTVVNVDRAILVRVLENLVENSLRYTPSRGKVAFDARRDKDVFITVSNSGPAIPELERGRIFEKFVRSGGRPSTQNTGLGLYFCKRALEAHGGGIDVVETAEYPAAFVIRLPPS